MVGLARVALVPLTIGISFCVCLVFDPMRISHKNSVEIPDRFYRKQLQGGPARFSSTGFSLCSVDWPPLKPHRLSYSRPPYAAARFDIAI